MKKILSIGLLVMLCAQFIQAGDTKSKVFPLSKTKFAVTGSNGEEKIVDLSGQNYIVVSLREIGGDGLA
jgi:hypothetical protein